MVELAAAHGEVGAQADRRELIGTVAAPLYYRQAGGFPGLVGGCFNGRHVD